MNINGNTINGNDEVKIAYPWSSLLRTIKNNHKGNEIAHIKIVDIITYLTLLHSKQNKSVITIGIVHESNMLPILNTPKTITG